MKEATALASAGFEITVLSARQDPARLKADKALASRHCFSIHPVDLVRTASPVRSFLCRLRSKLARTLHQFTGWESRFQLAVFVDDLYREARALDADYYISHIEPALWAGAQLLRDGRRVGIDIEDWYSEDLTLEARRHRPLKMLRHLEKRLLLECSHSTCTSRAMARALEEEYHCPPPLPIYNAFPWSDRQTIDGRYVDRKNCAIPSIHWYSQTIGGGRGLEDLLAALPLVKVESELHLRGNPVAGFDAWLQARLPESWSSRVFVHGLVSNEELLSRIAEHDIGFAGEMKYARNHDLTVSNKILHYLLAGLAVVASDTAGQREIAAQAGHAVLLYPSGQPDMLAARLNELLGSPTKLQSAKTAALHAAEQTFCWEKIAPLLVNRVSAALSPAEKRSRASNL